MHETLIQKQILQTFAFYTNITLWRANVGTHGFHVSLPKGFPDLFGYQSIIITPEMIGNTIAQFAFIEVKTPKGKASKEQKDMHQLLIEAGAVGGIARSPEDAIFILSK